MKTHARLIITLALAAFAALGLSACTTTPAAAAPPPVLTKTTVDLMLEVRSKELDLERTNQMAWLKYAAESDSDMVKGFVMGKASGAAPASGGSATQSIMQAQAQADATALRREELAAQNDWFNRGLQVLDRGLAFASFDKGLGFQKFQIRENNSQQRYTLDTVSNTSLSSQQAGYEFNSRIPYYFSLPAGSAGVAPAAATPATPE